MFSFALINTGLLAKTAAEIPAVQAYAASLKSGGAPVKAVAAAAPAAAVPVAAAPAAPAPAPIVNTGRVAASGYAQAVAKEAGVDLRTVTPSRSDGYITSRDLTTGSTSSATVSSGHVPAPGVINATPTARKLAAENNLDLAKIKGTGNFGRVTQDDVLIAAGKKQPPAPAPVAKAAAAPAAAAAAPAAAGKPATKEAPKVLDGVVAMDGMQKAVAKNMEKTLDVPIFRVSRYSQCCSLNFRF